MPDWVPQAVPDLCPRCGAYWECECARINVSRETLRAQFIPEEWATGSAWTPRMPDAFFDNARLGYALPGAKDVRPPLDEVGCQINLTRGEHIAPSLGTCRA